MTPHDESHELELEELLTRDDADAPAALSARAAACATCGRRIDEFLATAAAIDSALSDDFSAIDHERDQILAAAALAPRGPRSDVIDAGIRVGVLPIGARRARGPRRGFFAPAAALSAAALALFAFWLAQRDGVVTTPSSSPAKPSTAVLLSDDTDLRCVRPIGAVADFAAFEWTGSLVGGQSYTLIVRATDRTNADGSPLEIRKTDLFVPRYEPTPAERTSFGDAVEWEVKICDEFGSSTSTTSPVTATRATR